MTEHRAEVVVDDIFEKIRAEMTEDHLKKGCTREQIDDTMAQVMNIFLRDKIIEFITNNDVRSMVIYDAMIKGDIRKRLAK